MKEDLTPLEGDVLAVLHRMQSVDDVPAGARDRILTATDHATTILISHRFSTVRHADRICVLEHGRVVELGTHDELMAVGGRYRTMFELQASRFGEPAADEGVALDEPA